MSGALRSILEAACRKFYLSLDDLTVLSAQVDPYRLDTPGYLVNREEDWIR